jgi:endonuclease/exonuclease/phosphatase family metal-dependent hydrolase
MKKVALLILLTVSLSGFGQTLQFMTYNIRFDNPQDGVNEWSKRKQEVSDLIQRAQPDIIGVQEALLHQLDDLVKAMPEFTYVGVGRDDGKTKGEFSAILYRKNKFEALESNTFWLSETPDVPGSKNWDAMITRVASWIRLKDKKTKTEFIVINTHFDHIGVEARKQSALLLKSFISKLPSTLPIVVTGDFNCERTDEPYQVMVKNDGIQLFDSAPANAPGTFCNFEVNSMTCRAIDYIFYSRHWTNEKYNVITENDGKYYPSDHLPVTTMLRIVKKQQPKKK